jgi:hypothetical protein
MSNTKGFYKFLKRAIARKENRPISEPTKYQNLKRAFSDITAKALEENVGQV